jgi:hypothetical protein
MRKFFGIVLKVVFWLYFPLAAWLIYFSLAVPVHQPLVPGHNLQAVRHQVDSNFYFLENNWLQKNDYGLWEMYVEGAPFERGLASGVLCKELNEFQEEAFVEQIDKLIPSKSYLYFLRDLIAWFNRDIENYIPREYLTEINGIAQSADPRFDFIGPAYHRILNYHAAHDIGHALQNLALVGCTSFALNQNKADSSLIIGRNFDFYVNDDFAKNKIVAFVRPDSGYKFVFITWASFIGVVSGMNEAGLTVTINAAKSRYPTKSADPISLIAREILQYSGNIEDAVRIAHTRRSFVSESIMIASAADNKAVIIEKTPDTLVVYDPNESTLVCANHFQSDYFLHDSLNVQDMREGPSVYRERRCKQLIAADTSRDYASSAAILRDMRGLNNAPIGMGNEKAMNQLIAHHSVIFMPKRKLIWVSTAPWQLGAYLCYDLDKIFNEKAGLKKPERLYIDSLIIPEDDFLATEDYQKFLSYRKMKSELQTANFWGRDLENIEAFQQKFINSNPEYYYVYKLLGDYYFARKQWAEAAVMYRKVLSLEVEHRTTIREVQNRLMELEQKI